MSDELRVQRREACEHAPLDCDDFELPWRCTGCNGDGTRWVTVGTLDMSDLTPADLGWRGNDDVDRICVFQPTREPDTEEHQ